MGNSESSNPVRNMDKRTARREYRTDFMSAITRFRQTHCETGRSYPMPITDHWFDGSIKVFVRKRPIFKHEIDAYEFDVATCTSPTSIVVHDARMHNDMKRQLMNHHEFRFDRIFNELSRNDQVYDATAKSLVSISCDGGFSTCLVYGQTGSGKTFTMSSIYEQAAYDIFQHLDDVTARFDVQPTVTMSFVEIAGDAVNDLLNAFTPAQLLTGADGSVHAFPVVEPRVSTAEELIAMIQHGMGVRTTAATGVHDQSSRSHAVLRIYVQRHDKMTDYGPVEGTLTLVDLAGSEHRIDSMYHGKERRKETGNINASLMALKECIRARAAGQILSHQYRRSKLTLALKNSFALPAARTIVIATVSPASKDTEHSLNTLRHACIMHGQDTNSKETRFVTGGTTTTEQIGEINLTEIGRRNANIRRTGGTMDGPKTNNGNSIQDSRAALAANKEGEMTDKERARQRRLAEHRSISKLLPQYRDMLKFYRGKLGQDRQQASRLQRITSIAVSSTSSSSSPDDNGKEGPQKLLENARSQQQQRRHSSLSNEEAAEIVEEDPELAFHSSLNSVEKKQLRYDHSAAVRQSSPPHNRNGGRSGGGKQNRNHQYQEMYEEEEEEEEEAQRSEVESVDDDEEYVNVQQQQRQRQPRQESNSSEVESNDGNEEEEEEEIAEEDFVTAKPSPRKAVSTDAARVGAAQQKSIRLSPAGSAHHRQQQQKSNNKTPVLLRSSSANAGGASSSGSSGGGSGRKTSSSSNANAHASVGAGSSAEVEGGIAPPQGARQKRLEFQRLYETIYAVADSVPEHILRQQLTSVLSLHGYSETEIDLMFEMHALQTENENMKKGRQHSASSPPPPQQQQQKQKQQQRAMTPTNKRGATISSPPCKQQQQQQSQQRKIGSPNPSAMRRSPQPTTTTASTAAASVEYRLDVDLLQEPRKEPLVRSPRMSPSAAAANGGQQRSSSSGRSGSPALSSRAAASGNHSAVKKTATGPTATTTTTTATTSAAAGVGRFLKSKNGSQVTAIKDPERLAQNKQQREREAVAAAAAQLELDAAKKRQRQEAARALRQQQDDERRQRIARNSGYTGFPKSTTTAGIGGDDGDSNGHSGSGRGGGADTNSNEGRAASRNRGAQRGGHGSSAASGSSGFDNEQPIQSNSIKSAVEEAIQQHEEEIAELTYQLANDESMTQAAQYAMKKNIAVKKAALLRERRAAAQKSFLMQDQNHGGGSSSGGGGGGGGRPQSRPRSAPRGGGRGQPSPQPRPVNPFDELPVGGHAHMQSSEHQHLQQSPSGGAGRQIYAAGGLGAGRGGGGSSSMRGKKGGGGGGGGGADRYMDLSERPDMVFDVPAPAERMESEDSFYRDYGVDNNDYDNHNGTGRNSHTTSNHSPEGGGGGGGGGGGNGSLLDVMLGSRQRDHQHTTASVAAAQQRAEEVIEQIRNKSIYTPPSSSSGTAGQRKSPAATSSSGNDDTCSNNSKISNSGSRRARNNVGAGAAPFANDYSWNSPPEKSMF